MRIVILLAAALAINAAQGVSARTMAPGPISYSELGTKARDACRGTPTLSRTAVQRADIDGDNKPDIVFDWSQVTCGTGGQGSQGAGFCGMHNCSVDVYLSSQYKPGGWPKPIMNHREITPRIVRDRPTAVLRTSYQGGSCEFAKVCHREWRWDGGKFVSREISDIEFAGRADVRAELAINQANVTGNWVDEADGCATDLNLSLRADGSYGSFEEMGDWRLIGNRIAIVARTTFIMGEAGSEKQVANPAPVMLDVLWLSSAHMTVRRPNGQLVTFNRCG